MLSRLYIENLAVISKAELALTEGFNVLTGETGAGKTVLIGALGAVLGARTQKGLIRTGEAKAQVTAVFRSLSLAVDETLRSLGYEPEEDGTLMISRTIRPESTDCRVNGQPATATILKTLAPMLVDLHGQHDNARLLSSDYHLALLDAYANVDALHEPYRESYRRWCALKKELESLNLDEGEKARRIDLLEYQIEEITAAQLVPGEEEELEASRTLMRNAERVAAALGAARELLSPEYGEQSGIEEMVSSLCNALSAAARYIHELEPSSARMTDISYELGDLSHELSGYLDSLDFSPQQLDETEARLSILHTLSMKYGGSVPAVLAHCARAQEELESITNSDQKREKLEKACAAAFRGVRKAADALSTARREAGQRFVKEVEKQLAYLDMPSVRLTVSQEKRELGPSGQDSVELLIAPNPGEPPKPVAKIASGGEISRIMLSIKNVMVSESDGVTSIFDEVDTGVSGRAADKIGHKLAAVARGRQVLCVTHLAQVAAYADNHLLIHKRTDGVRAFTEVIPLPEEGHVQELARIISGDAVTPAALANATEMIAAAHAKKKEPEISAPHTIKKA